MLSGLDLFSGIGGLTLALSPWVKTLAYCERDDFSRAVLLSRMSKNDVTRAPIWTDIRTLGRTQIDVPIDIVFGGFPCQPFSGAARGRNTALDLWPEMRRVVSEIRPRFVFAENVEKKAIDAAAIDLRTGGGYVVRCVQVSAASVGAAHQRDRYWLLADAHGDFKLRVALDAQTSGPQKARDSRQWQKHRPELLGVDDGLPYRMDRLSALGNAVVPQAARRAFEFMMWEHP